VAIATGVNTMLIEVISEDGTVRRTYSVVIQRKVDENAAKLWDIQLSNMDTGESVPGKMVYYDLAPVFDPDLMTYVFATPWLMKGELTLKPITFDRDAAAGDKKYGVRYSAYLNDSKVMSGVEITGGSIKVPELTASQKYRVEIEVYSTAANVTMGSNIYTLLFTRNDQSEEEAIHALTLAERMAFSPFTDIKLDGMSLIRPADEQPSDKGYYFNTSKTTGTLSVSPQRYLMANGHGYKTYLYDMNSYNPLTGKFSVEEVFDLDQHKLNYTKDDNWYVLEFTDGTNRFYSSVTVYKDSSAGSGNPLTSTKLANLAATNPVVPLYRENTNSYFVSMDEGTTAADLIARLGHVGGQNYQTEVRVRSVGGEYLTALESAKNIPLHQGTNRVTVTVKTVRLDAEQHRATQKRAYEVEFYVAAKTQAVANAGGNLEAKQNRDTGDIIWMDYTSGGHLTPIWNSELVNYFLDYPYFSDQ
ncbi:MAG: hypothetical protein RSC08_07435, partial [Oscillospiraceae bacterium]